MELECVSCEEDIEEVGGGGCSPALERAREAGLVLSDYRSPPACLSSWFLSWQQPRSSSATDLWSALLPAVKWWCATTYLTQRGESSYSVKITLVLSVWAQCFKLCFLLHPSRDSREPFRWQWKFLVLALVLPSPIPDSMGKRQFQPGGRHGIPGYLGLKHKEVSRCQWRR